MAKSLITTMGALLSTLESAKVTYPGPYVCGTGKQGRYVSSRKRTCPASMVKGPIGGWPCPALMPSRGRLVDVMKVMKFICTIIMLPVCLISREYICRKLWCFRQFRHVIAEVMLLCFRYGNFYDSKPKSVVRNV